MDFARKYIQLAPIGTGGFGSVYSGYRVADLLPVSLTNAYHCIHTHSVPFTGIVSSPDK